MVNSADLLGDGKIFQPGFRFHPTDDELVLYYLKRKICKKRHRLDVIGETDVYKWDPEELPGMSKLKTGDRQWFFFTPRDRKYPNGGRCNRVSRHGYWKATGKDRAITCGSRTVGLKKTLVFYKGRAPKGERTDWVMHEYTMDEEELRRCQNAQDYYALYKVFKKSGAGPKNGEQYGALFREEDWADDVVETQSLLQLGNPVKQDNAIVPADNTKETCNNTQQLSADTFEEILNQKVDDSLSFPPLGVDYGYAPNQFYGGKESQSALTDHSSRNGCVPILQPCGQEHDVQAIANLTQSGSAEFQSVGAHEVTFAPNVSGQAPLVIEEDFLEDFLEMNDLIGPQPTAENTGESVDTVEKLQFYDCDGFNEFDLFQDASALLNELGHHELGQKSGPFQNNFEDGHENLTPSSNMNCLGNSTVVSDLQPQTNGANGISYQLFSDEQTYLSTASDANQGSIPSSTSGALCQNQNHNIVSNPAGANENGGRTLDDGTDSWFSSALWAFVESIPTTPASASESALVNGAIGRMSNFRRFKINTVNTNVCAGYTSATKCSLGKSRSGFLCFSILGALFAMVWMVMGTVRMRC